MVSIHIPLGSKTLELNHTAARLNANIYLSGAVMSSSRKDKNLLSKRCFSFNFLCRRKPATTCEEKMKWLEIQLIYR